MSKHVKFILDTPPLDQPSILFLLAIVQNRLQVHALMTVTNVPVGNELNEKEKVNKFKRFSLTHFTQQKRKLIGVATHFLFVDFINVRSFDFCKFAESVSRTMKRFFVPAPISVYRIFHSLILVKKMLQYFQKNRN